MTSGKYLIADPETGETREATAEEVLAIKKTMGEPDVMIPRMDFRYSPEKIAEIMNNMSKIPEHTIKDRHRKKPLASSFTRKLDGKLLDEKDKETEQLTERQRKRLRKKERERGMR